LTDTSAIPQDASDIKVVSGLDVLSNNNVRTLAINLSAHTVLTLLCCQVNLISSTLTAVALGYFA
jgi:hypothetical protein